jgi:hypothetical protein
MAHQDSLCDTQPAIPSRSTQKPHSRTCGRPINSDHVVTVGFQRYLVGSPGQPEAQPPHRARCGRRQRLPRNRAGDEPLLPVPALQDYREARHAVIVQVAFIATMKTVQIYIKEAVARDYEKSSAGPTAQRSGSSAGPTGIINTLIQRARSRTQRISLSPSFAVIHR